MKKFLSLVGIVCVLAVLVGALSGVTFAANPIAVATKADGSGTEDIADVTALNAALANTAYSRVTLTGDLATATAVKIGVATTFDLGGYTLTYTTGAEGAVQVDGGSCMLKITDKVTIENGTIIASWYGVYLRNCQVSDLVLNDLNVVAGISPRAGTTTGTAALSTVKGSAYQGAETPAATVSIKNTTLVSLDDLRSIHQGANTTMTTNLDDDVHLYCLAETPSAGTQTITAASGELTQVEANWGYRVKIGDNTYTGLNYWTTATTPNENASVAKAYANADDTVPACTLGNEAALRDAVSSGLYAKVELVADVELAAALKPTAAIVIDLGGKNLTYRAATAGAVHVEYKTIDGTVTVRNGTILASYYGVYVQGAEVLPAEADFVLDNLTIVAGRTLRANPEGSTLGSSAIGTANAHSIARVTITNSVLISQDDNAPINRVGGTLGVTVGEGVTMYGPNTVCQTNATAFNEEDVYVAGISAPGIDGIGPLYKWSTNEADARTGDVLAYAYIKEGATDGYPLYTTDDFTAAVAANSQTRLGYIKLERNVEDFYLRVGRSVTIDLNEKEWINTTNNGIQVNRVNATVTVKNGKVKGTAYAVYAYADNSDKTVHLTLQNVVAEETAGSHAAVGIRSTAADSTLTIIDCTLISAGKEPIWTKNDEGLDHQVTLQGSLTMYGKGTSYCNGAMVTLPEGAMIVAEHSDIAGLNKWKTAAIDINPSAALYMDDPWGYRITVEPMDQDGIYIWEEETGLDVTVDALYYLPGEASLPSAEYIMENGESVAFVGATADLVGVVKVAELNDAMNFVIKYTVGEVTETYSIRVSAADILEASKEADSANAEVYDAMQALFEAFTAYEAEVGDRTALEVIGNGGNAASHFTDRQIIESELTVKTYAAAYLMEPWGIRFSTELRDASDAVVTPSENDLGGVMVSTTAYETAAEMFVADDAYLYQTEASGSRFTVAYNGLSTLALDDTLCVVSYVDTADGVICGPVRTISVMGLLEYLVANEKGTAAELAVIGAMIDYATTFAAHNS